MKFKFDCIINRRNTNSYKWNVAENELPMWVADMDFATTPLVVDALVARAQFGIFGYETVSDEWYQVIQDWWGKRHRFCIEKDWLIFSTGVVATISSAIRKLTTPGEKVLVMSPVYNIFYNSIVNNGRQVESCDLQYQRGIGYHINFVELENKLADPQVTFMLLCNPHNPIGKIWSKENLRHIGELCEKHNVIVLSDEIHCDIIEQGCEYTPFASVSECCANNSITCISPTKAFNLAGIQTSAVVVPNKTLRHKVWRALNTDEVAEPNSFAITATIIAFSKGKTWLESLLAYISANKRTARDFIARELPQIAVVPSEATYLLWIDCGDVANDASRLGEFIQSETGLLLSSGEQFGENGKQFLRMNVACSRKHLIDGLDRLKKAILLYTKNNKKV